MLLPAPGGPEIQIIFPCNPSQMTKLLAVILTMNHNYRMTTLKLSDEDDGVAHVIGSPPEDGAIVIEAPNSNR